MSFKKTEKAMLKSLGAHDASTDEVMIRFEDVVKTYYLYPNDRDRLLGLFSRKAQNRAKKINANDGLSFEIKKGEAVALLGLNGAGKSTALKMITGVCHPTSGSVEVNGRVSALLELKAGFDGKLSGRENLALRSQIIGLDKNEFEEIEAEIIEFADLGDYIDQPMKMYSSGMKARLGFALASIIEPDILVVDEALSVGDRKFRKKCIARMSEIMSKDDVTILFVSHSMKTVQSFCTRGLVLEHGKLVYDAPIDEAVEYYEAHT